MAIPNDSFEKALRLRSQALNRIHKLPRSIPPAGTAAKPVVTGGIFTPGQQRQSPADYYAGIIERDPSVIQGAADLRAKSIFANNQAADPFRQMVTNYGMVPAGIQDPYGWLNDETRALADKATASGVSQFARMKRAYEMGQLMRRRQLAARGMIQSGAFTQSMGEGDRNFQLQQYDALQELLDRANQLRSGYAQGELERTQQLNTLRSEAASRAAQMPLPTPAAPAAVAKPRAPVEQPWQKALRLRSQALNKRYGL